MMDSTALPTDRPENSVLRILILVCVIVALFQASRFLQVRAEPTFGIPGLIHRGAVAFDLSREKEPILLSLAVSPRGDIGLLDSKSGSVQVFGSDRQLRFVTPVDLPGAGRLLRPQALAFGAHEEIYVADTGNQRVVQFTPQGEIRLLGKPGIFNGQFALPTALVTVENNLYVLDSALCRVQQFGPEGEFLAKVGSKGTSAGQFQTPTALAFDENGNLLVIDSRGSTVSQFDSQLTFAQARRIAGTSKPFPVTRAATAGNGLSFYLSKERQEIIVFYQNTAVDLLTPRVMVLGDAYWTDLCGRENSLYLLDARNRKVDLFELM